MCRLEPFPLRPVEHLEEEVPRVPGEVADKSEEESAPDREDMDKVYRHGGEESSDGRGEGFQKCDGHDDGNGERAKPPHGSPHSEPRQKSLRFREVQAHLASRNGRGCPVPGPRGCAMLADATPP